MVRSRAGFAGRRAGSAAALAALVALLGGCAATGAAGRPGRQARDQALSANQYRALQATLRESSTARAEFTRVCVRGKDGEPAEAKRGMAIMLDVPSAEVSQVFCERFVAALRVGRLTYEDFAAIQGSDEDESRMRRLVSLLRDPSLSPTI